MLQDALRVLAEEHHSLEQSIRSQSSRPDSMGDSDDDEFHDCFDASKSSNLLLEDQLMTVYTNLI